MKRLSIVLATLLVTLLCVGASSAYAAGRGMGCGANPQCPQNTQVSQQVTGVYSDAGYDIGQEAGAGQGLSAGFAQGSGVKLGFGAGGKHRGLGTAFVNTDGDGVCDNAMLGKGFGTGFVDKDKDGVCDNAGLYPNRPNTQAASGTAGNGQSFGCGICKHCRNL